MIFTFFSILSGLLGVVWLLATLFLIGQFVFTPFPKKRQDDWIFAGGMVLAVVGILNLLYALNLPNTFSQTQPTSSDVWSFSLAVSSILGVLSIPWLVSGLIAKFSFKRALSSAFNRCLLLLPVVTIALFLLLGLIYDGQSPHASEYFQLNAAIKNTCLLDPQRDHCPTKLEEISYIEPAEFKRVSGIADLLYTYDSASNQYTFVVRYTPYRAVVFDQRLLPFEGVDFKEFEVTTFGQDKIKNPPPFSGPWELSDWKSSW